MLAKKDFAGLSADAASLISRSLLVVLAQLVWGSSSRAGTGPCPPLDGVLVLEDEREVEVPLPRPTNIVSQPGPGAGWRGVVGAPVSPLAKAARVIAEPPLRAC